jgi:hypothetical protein
MKIQPFSDPELYLLNRWESAMLLESSMKAVRDKYEQIFGAALDRLEQQYKGLDCRTMHLSDKEDPSVSVGKKSWPSMYPNWPSGFWLGCIGLDNLTSEDADDPYASVFFNPPKSAVFEIQGIVRRLRDSAKTILTKEQMDRVREEVRKGHASIYYPLPEPRRELLEMLMNNKSAAFIDCIVAHLETLAKFIPVMDEVSHGGRLRSN